MAGDPPAGISGLALMLNTSAKIVLATHAQHAQLNFHLLFEMIKPGRDQLAIIKAIVLDRSRPLKRGEFSPTEI